MDDFKRIVAKNITALRTSMNLTQAQLGERLNYSDKSVSKWERGDSVPDVFVLKKIADMGGVTVDWMLADHGGEPVAVPAERRILRYSRRFITLTVVAGIWALAVMIFVLMWMTGTVLWLVFVYTVPVCLVTLLVLNSVWGTRENNLYIISGIVWGAICAIYLSFLSRNWWQLFLIGVPAQIIILFAFSIRNKTKE